MVTTCTQEVVLFKEIWYTGISVISWCETAWNSFSVQYWCYLYVFQNFALPPSILLMISIIPTSVCLLLACDCNAAKVIKQLYYAINDETFARWSMVLLKERSFFLLSNTMLLHSGRLL